MGFGTHKGGVWGGGGVDGVCFCMATGGVATPGKNCYVICGWGKVRRGRGGDVGGVDPPAIMTVLWRVILTVIGSSALILLGKACNPAAVVEQRWHHHVGGRGLRDVWCLQSRSIVGMGGRSGRCLHYPAGDH